MFLEGVSYVYWRHPRDNYPHRSHRLGCAQGVNDLPPRVELNSLLVFLALWLGGLFWGMAGILLAPPALGALKVIAENATSGKAMIQFLGANDPQEIAKAVAAIGRIDAVRTGLHPSLLGIRVAAGAPPATLRPSPPRCRHPPGDPTYPRRRRRIPRGPQFGRRPLGLAPHFHPSVHRRGHRHHLRYRSRDER